MKEEDIRPKHIFDHFLQLAGQDVEKYFSDAPRRSINCPVCSCEGKGIFNKKGFNYMECERCLTWYVSPRPDGASFSKYYRESESVKYWATTFYQATSEARRKHLWKPKVQRLLRQMRDMDVSGHRVLDIGGGYGIFAEEVQKKHDPGVHVIEPSPALAQVCRGKGLPVIEAFLEDLDSSLLPQGPSVFVSFELFEHLHDPAVFLDCLARLMGPGDLFMFTTLSGTGLDIRVLGAESKAVSPPHHLNFFNPRSIRQLLGSRGYEVLDVQTPGLLDLDILWNQKDSVADAFWRAYLQQSTESDRETLQKVISNQGWSSHMLVWCRLR